MLWLRTSTGRIWVMPELCRWPRITPTAASLHFGSNSNYNGLQVSYKKRMSQGIQFGVNYTWSKSLGHYEPGIQ